MVEHKAGLSITSKLMETTACIESKGKVIVAKDSPSQRVIDRINKVNALFCDMQQRIRVETSILIRYCPPSSSTSTSDSGSISEPECCPAGPCLPDEPEFQYLINVTDLDEDVYEILELLEAEVCATNERLKDFEEMNDDCHGSAVSDSISKSISDSISKSKSDSLSASISNSESESKSDSDSLSKSISDSDSDSLSKSLSDSISQSISDSDSDSKSESDSISKSNSDSISKSISDSDSISKSISDSKSLSDSQSQSLSEAEMLCDFLLQGIAWTPTGVELFVGQVTNDGPDPVLITGIKVLPTGLVDSVTPSFPPLTLLMGEAAAITIGPIALPDELVGIVIETPCGKFLYPYGVGGTFTGPLILL